jgi:phage terminase large subunit-like protein
VSESLLEQAAKAVGEERLLSSLTPDQWRLAKYAWRDLLARPEQLEPKGDWHMWLILAGRGFGKTRSAAEWVRMRVESGQAKRIILAAPTFGDLISDMLWGESGLMQVSPPWNRPHFNTSNNMISWPNGAVGVCLTAEKPDKFRGKQGDTVWCDEIAAWQYPEAFDMLRFGMRLGDPRFCLTTTPKPTPLIRELIKTDGIKITRGSTYDNAANLSPKFLQDIRAKYEGTRLGRQELYAEVLDDVEGALWNHGLIEKTRIPALQMELRRIVVAVDPSGSAKRTADEAGIVVAGIGECACLGRKDTHAFVLEDLTGRYSPRDMGTKAVDAYHKYKASRLVAEDNFGGKIIEDLIQLIDRSVAYRAVHASRGKLVRAEPVAALYEQGRVHHVGLFKELEDEMCSYAPLVSTESPGRLDALVWTLTDLMLGEGRASIPDLGDMPKRRW